MWGIIVPSVTSLLVAGIGSWGMFSLRVSDIDTKIQVVEEREENHYKELTKAMERVDGNVTSILNLLNKK